MNPSPIALGLMLCDYVIVEQGTSKISLIGTFARMTFDSFPTKPRTFSVCTTLTSGLGEATAELILTHPETGENMWSRTARIRFADRLSDVPLIFPVEQSFPIPGRYLFYLLVDGVWIAQRHFELFAARGTT